jgi:hypothetical protein
MARAIITENGHAHLPWGALGLAVLEQEIALGAARHQAEQAGATAADATLLELTRARYCETLEQLEETVREARRLWCAPAPAVPAEEPPPGATLDRWQPEQPLEKAWWKRRADACGAVLLVLKVHRDITGRIEPTHAHYSVPADLAEPWERAYAILTVRPGEG